MNDYTTDIQRLTDPKKWLLCPRCNSGSVIFKSKTIDYGCRRCGAVFTADFDKETTTYKPHKGEIV